MDQDRDLDILGTGQAGINWYENNGSQVYTTNIVVTGFEAARSVKSGDIDRDGD